VRFRGETRVTHHAEQRLPTPPFSFSVARAFSLTWENWPASQSLQLLRSRFESLPMGHWLHLRDPGKLLK
jgi:hypothetical protein